ncbi:DUF456 domain-containing protein [Opitutaceae bacterium TAV4]|nr:DUF456 domain-containing protein [Opitutaceae bacterium TAV4]RRK01159.1 DUF456 domain-containing protein [Opitutaceae bacterium TAV3]
MADIWAASYPFLIWTLTGVCILIGLAGVVLPVLPGTTMILIGMAVHQWLLPEMGPGWGSIGVIAVVWLVSVVGEFLSALIGTRLFGGSNWGAAGATGGALVGVFFSLPIMLLGTVLGAMVAEHCVAKKDTRTTLLAGVGAATGFVIATIIKGVCAAGMIAVFVFGLC